MTMALITARSPRSPNEVRSPPVPVRTSISEYRRGELIQLVRWIASDGRLRADDQIIDEIIPELGFSRRGVLVTGTDAASLVRIGADPWQGRPVPSAP